MPEYSSTTITPADGVKTPAMEGSTSGNYTLAALRAFILASKGLANGLASLDANGKLLTSQLPDLADDVLVYGSYALLPSPGTAGKLYITADDNKMYRWDADLATPAYVELSVDLSAYATKAELAVEESAREAADTDLKNALDSTNARVENLEQEHGSYQEVSVKSPYTIPSGKAKNWSVNVLRGVCRAANSLIQVQETTTINGITMTNNGDGSYTLNGTATADFSRGLGGGFAVIGHQILYGFANLGSAISGVSLNEAWSMGKVTVLEIRTKSVYANYDFRLLISNGTTLNNVRIVPIACDLTSYFGGSIPSDADTIAEIQQNYPELLVPSAYGNSLVSTTYEEVRSKARNLLDRTQATEGKILDASGTLVSLSGCAVSDYIPITPSVLYYLKSTAINNQYQVHWFDINKTWIGRNLGSTSNSTTSNANAFYARVNFQTSDTSVCFNKSDSQDGTFTPFFTDTLSLPTPVPLRSAGTVAEEFDLETGEKTNPLSNEVNLADLTWTAGFSNYIYATIADIKRSVDSSTKPNIICSNIVVGTISEVVNSGVNAQYITVDNTNSRLLISTDSTKTWRPTSGKLIYELATPNPSTQLDPIENPYLATESGGTISSILTEAVDDSMTLGYINL